MRSYKRDDARASPTICPSSHYFSITLADDPTRDPLDLPARLWPRRSIEAMSVWILVARSLVDLAERVLVCLHSDKFRSRNCPSATCASSFRIHDNIQLHIAPRVPVLRQLCIRTKIAVRAFVRTVRKIPQHVTCHSRGRKLMHNQ